MKRIGHYIVRGLLGRGGMGKVFKVELPMVGKAAALKLLDPNPLVAKLLGNAKLRDLFLTEAKTMARLNHPNIVALHDFDEDQGKPFYVMDFHAHNLGALIGESYHADQRSRTIRVDKALDYLRQTLAGLACLHEAGIIHRDIKPFNLLLTELDCVKICDFGLSRTRGEFYSGPSQLNFGSPFYAAPEQEKSPDAVGPNADLYPLGIMLYRMLIGRLPEYPPHHPHYQKPSSLHSELDANWDRFIARAASIDPRERFADVDQMRQALDALTQHWQDLKKQTCSLPAPEAVFSQSTPMTPRRVPVKMAPRQAVKHFGLDSMWMPRVYATIQQSPSAQTVVDHTTRLIWQRSGSRYPCTWAEAANYIETLNSNRFARHIGWRLPTIDELVTLLRPPPQIQDLCIAPLFDSVQRWIWSADRRSFIAAYYVDVQLGFVGWQDLSALYYVRAVCVPSADEELLQT